jgi:hypothetical protein
MDRWITANKAQGWFVAALLVVFAAVSVQYTIKVLTPRNGETTRSAIVRWRDQLLQLDAGENIYEKFTYPNPPIMALLLRPIAELPPLTGALVWYYLKVAMALASFAMVFRLSADVGVDFPPWAKAVAVLLCLRPVLGDLMHGNVNLLILFLVVSALMLFRNEWDLGAGIALALAIACKVTPALFVPYFLWKGAWRVLIGVTIGLALFLFVVPAAFLGWAENWTMLSSWTQNMVTPFLVGGVVTSEHSNQSLPGLVQRLLTASPSFSDYQGDRYVPLAYHNFIDVGRAAGWITKGMLLLFSLLVVGTCRTPLRDRTRASWGAEFAIICLGMLLFSERTWKHHAVVLMVPFVVLCYQFAAAELNRSRRWLIVAALVSSALLMFSTSTAAWPDAWAKLAQVYGAYTLTFLILLFASACVLIPAPTASQTEQRALSQAA